MNKKLVLYVGSQENCTVEPLAEVFGQCREEIIEEWQLQAGKLLRELDLDKPTITDHLSDVVAEITRDLALSRDGTLSVEQTRGSPPVHNVQRFHDGLDVGEVVAEYNLLRVVFDTVAERHDLCVVGEAARIVNHRIDEGVRLAVMACAAQQALVRKEQEDEHLAFIAHDLRTPLNAVSLLVEELRRGQVKSGTPPKKWTARAQSILLEDFAYDQKSDSYPCPQGKVLKLYARQHRSNRGENYRRYRSRREDCAQCPWRDRCLNHNAERKWLALPVGTQPATLTAQMRRKIDQPEARRIYGRRLAIVEPVFANLRSNKRLDRFTYRGTVKVNIQWLLYCLVHNIEQIAHYGKSYPFKGGRRVLKKTLFALSCFFACSNNCMRQFFGQLALFDLFYLTRVTSSLRVSIPSKTLLIRQPR